MAHALILLEQRTPPLDSARHETAVLPHGDNVQRQPCLCGSAGGEPGIGTPASRSLSGTNHALTCPFDIAALCVSRMPRPQLGPVMGGYTGHLSASISDECSGLQAGTDQKFSATVRGTRKSCFPLGADVSLLLVSGLGDLDSFITRADPNTKLAAECQAGCLAQFTQAVGHGLHRACAFCARPRRPGLRDASPALIQCSSPFQLPAVTVQGVSGATPLNSYADWRCSKQTQGCRRSSRVRNSAFPNALQQCAARQCAR